MIRKAGSIRVLTFNTWLLDIPLISGLPGLNSGRKNLDQRLGAMPGFLANFDMVGLCEVFNRGHWNFIRGETAAIFPGRAGTVPRMGFLQGSGLLLLSRWPVEEFEERIFKISGRHSDYWARKGMLHARIRLPDLTGAGDPRRLDVFLTHLQASPRSGSESQTALEVSDDYQIVRRTQLEELRAFIREKAGGHPTLLLGDFNIAGESSEYRNNLKDFEGFHDLWPLAGSGGEGFTFDRQANPLVRAGLWVRERLDYLLYRDGRDSGFQVTECQIQRPYWTKPHPHRGGQEMPLSDHFGVSALLVPQS